MVSEDFEPVRERLRGFREVLNNHNIALPDAYHFTVARGARPSFEPTATLLRSDPRPDGIFYYNDSQAVIGLRALKQAELEIPGDVAVVGCDNSDICAMANPPLTTIRQETEALGLKAFEFLQHLITASREERFASRSDGISVRIVERDSARAQ